MRRPTLDRLAAFAEIVLVAIAFNLVASLVLRQFVSPEAMDLAEDYSQGDLYPGAAVSALRLTVRFGIAIALGFGLLRWRRGVGPVETGVTRAGRSWASLLLTGVVTWAVATIPFDLLYLANGIVPFGEGFALFGNLDELLGRPDFWAIWLAGAVVLPPLYEEIFFRGYARARLAEAYGPFGAVVVSSLLFMLMHGHFYSTDPVKLLTLVTNVLAVMCWAFVAWRTGSIVPAIVAHALGNLPFPRTVPVIGTLLVVQLVIIAAARVRVGVETRAFVEAWREADHRAVAFGVTLALLCLVPLMTLAAMGERRALLIAGGSWSLFLAVVWGVSVIRERSARIAP